MPASDPLSEDPKPDGTKPDSPESDDVPQTPKRIGWLRSAQSWVLLLLVVVLLIMLFQPFSEKRSQVKYSFFRQQVVEGNVKRIEVQGRKAYGEFRKAPLAPVDEKPEDQPDSKEDQDESSTELKPDKPATEETSKADAPTAEESNEEA